MIKKFDKFKVDESSDESIKVDVENRFDIQHSIFDEAIKKVNEIVEEELNTPTWPIVGSLANVNSNLINIIEGWDEKLAIELRKRFEH